MHFLSTGIDELFHAFAFPFPVATKVLPIQLSEAILYSVWWLRKTVNIYRVWQDEHGHQAGVPVL